MRSTARGRRVVATAALVLGVLALTACTGTDADRQRSAQAWLDRTADAVADPDGWDSGGGQLLRSGDGAEGGFISESTPAGDYDVVTVCRDAGAVRVTVRVFPEGRDGEGGVLAGKADLRCGRTARIPVTVPAGSGVWVRARTSDRSEYALWYSTIATPGWTPTAPAAR
jgi:hypothetical protein